MWITDVKQLHTTQFTIPHPSKCDISLQVFLHTVWQSKAVQRDALAGEWEKLVTFPGCITCHTFHGIFDDFGFRFRCIFHRQLDGLCVFGMPHGTICSSACGHNEAMFNGNRKQEKNRPNQLIFNQDDICNILWLYMNAECTVDKYYRIPRNNTLKSFILHPFQFALFDCHFQSRSCQRERWWKCRTIRRLQLQ